MMETCMAALKNFRLFVIFYIIVAIIVVSLVNIIFQFLRLMNRRIEEIVSPKIPLNILKQCLDAFDKIESEQDENDLIKYNFKYDCVVFGGGGYKTIQYIGYLAYLLKHDLIDENTKFIGSSLGSCCSVIAIIAYDIYCKNGKRKLKNNDKLLNLLSYLLIHCMSSRINILSLFGNWWNKFHASLNEILHKFDVDMKLFENEKLEIVTTKVFPLPSKQIFNKFQSKIDLLNCLCASCMIPFWSSNSPLYHWKNNYYLDGGFTDLIPQPSIKNSLIVYNDAVWYRTFVPFLNQDDYVNDIVNGYIKCHKLAQNVIN